MKQPQENNLQQVSTNFFEFFTKKEAKKHLNQLFTLYLNSSEANNLSDRQKKLFFKKQLKKIIKRLSKQ
ncbi:hypothetical protein CJ739_63 [Mariniflexile rhizosphaerae]|uniref:hypothetical protein n=1 Tax=unclassified Mariniflexile TaxID=2643887 RepID=UPI000E3339BF|nr:hypothetical protein CJ739_63 [Mariniflexile sp. TRM1-10]